MGKGHPHERVGLVEQSQAHSDTTDLIAKCCSVAGDWVVKVAA